MDSASEDSVLYKGEARHFEIDIGEVEIGEDQDAGRLSKAKEDAYRKHRALVDVVLEMGQKILDERLSAHHEQLCGRLQPESVAQHQQLRKTRDCTLSALDSPSVACSQAPLRSLLLNTAQISENTTKTGVDGGRTCDGIGAVASVNATQDSISASAANIPRRRRRRLMQAASGETAPVAVSNGATAQHVFPNVVAPARIMSENTPSHKI